MYPLLILYQILTKLFFHVSGINKLLQLITPSITNGQIFLTFENQTISRGTTYYRYRL